MPRNWRTPGVAPSTLPWTTPFLVLTLRSRYSELAPVVAANAVVAASATENNRMMDVQDSGTVEKIGHELCSYGEGTKQIVGNRQVYILAHAPMDGGW